METELTKIIKNPCILNILNPEIKEKKNTSTCIITQQHTEHNIAWIYLMEARDSRSKISYFIADMNLCVI